MPLLNLLLYTHSCCSRVPGMACLPSTWRPECFLPLMPALPVAQRQEAERDSAIAAALEPAQETAAAAGGAAPMAPTAAAAAPQQGPRQLLFSSQSQQQLQQAQQAAPLKGFLSGGLLGTPGPAAPGGPGRLPRFGGGSSGTALDARAHTAAGAAGGVAGVGGQLPEGVVGEREFDRMLGLAAPRGAGGRPQRAGRLARPA